MHIDDAWENRKARGVDDLGYGKIGIAFSRLTDLTVDHHDATVELVLFVPTTLPAPSDKK